MRAFSYSILAAIAAAAPSAAQNDECTDAIALVPGVATPFDTTSATLSAPAWPCAASTAPDLWYAYTATGGGTVTFDTCGSSYDCALEAFTGPCAGASSLLCVDDSCGLQAAITIPATAGATYFVRVGGFGTSSGAGTITATEGPPLPPFPNDCVQTIVPFLSNGGGSFGGAVYFDLTATQDVTFSGLTTSYGAAAGTPVGVTVYTTPGTHVGNEPNVAAWTQVAVDDGTAVAAGVDMETSIAFATPFDLSAGTYGIALVASGSGHRYTNGNGSNQTAMSADGVLSTSAGAASNVPFAPLVFTPRVWNGRLCHGGAAAPGVSYCGPAVPNSTGSPGVMSAAGSASFAANDLVIIGSQLPVGAFAYFLASTTQGFTPMPGGSQGNLCLGGAIGRFVGPGQVRTVGANGECSLAVDWLMMPAPGGFVPTSPGTKWSFQCWHRDLNPGVTSNFTDGRAITVAP